MDNVSDESNELALDPFAFHGHPASAIIGLGGERPLPDPSYAFHTPYVPVARGHAHFIVRFTDLKARRGSLVLRVHMLPGEPGATARMVTSQRLQLNWLAHHGGETRLRFEAFRGATYAIMGLVPDQTDASADALSVTLDRPADARETAATGGATAAQATAFGDTAMRPASMLLALDPPTFASPVSQPCTADQLREPAFRARVGRRRVPAGEQAGTWTSAYVVQVLDRYGLLRPGARGLALGEPGAWVRDAIAAAGATCRVVALGAGEGDCIDPATLPGELFAFDFLLTIRAVDGFANDAVARAFVESAMECLRPGGFAVHVVGHVPEARTTPGLWFDRNGLQRLALALISRGHEVARLRPAPTQRLLSAPGDAAFPFGLVARRAGSIL